MNTLSATDTYLSLLFALPGLTPITVLSVFFLTLARLLPIMVMAPFLGSQNVPVPIRMMFSVALTAIFLPKNLLAVHQEISLTMSFIGYSLKELAIGTILGFLAAAPFFIAQMSGSLIDFQRGAASLQVTDPTTRSQTGPIGIFFNLVLIAVFFISGGPFLFFNSIAISYELIPVDGLINPLFFRPEVAFWTEAIDLISKMFNLCVQLAAPALIGIFFTNMFLGIANRLAPQVQIVFLGIPLTSWAGIALLAAAWSLTIQVLDKSATQWMQMIEKFIQQVGRVYVN